MSIFSKIKSLFSSEPHQKTEKEEALERIKKLTSKEWFANAFIPRSGMIHLEGKYYASVDGLIPLYVNGSGISKWDIRDGDVIYIEPLTKFDSETFEHYPVVLVEMHDDLKNEVRMKKFCGYIDINSKYVDDISTDIIEKRKNQHIATGLPDYDYDIYGYRKYWSKNKKHLSGITRDEFTMLCMKKLCQLIRNNQLTDGDPHRMAIICVCYSDRYEYDIVFTNQILGKAKYRLCNH